MSAEETIAQLAADKEPTDSSLAELSGLGRDELACFEQAWSRADPERRRRIMSRLVALANENVALSFDGIFKGRLRDPDDTVRCLAIDGLWEHEAPSLIRPLIDILEKDSSAAVRARAATALGRFALLSEHGKLSPEHAAMVTDALLSAVEDEERPAEVRCCALRAAAPLSLPQVDRAILDSYHGDSRFQLSAICAMGLSCNPAWLPVLLHELKSPDAEVREEAATALGELEEEEAVPELAELIYDDEKAVRLAAIRALGQIGGTEAKESIEQCLDDPDATISRAAEEALAHTAAQERLASLEP